MNKYLKLSNERLEEHLNNYFLDHLSYSCIEKFCSNPKDFERKYIMAEKEDKGGVAMHAGNAYHHALQKFFEHLRETKQVMDFETLVPFGWDYIDDIKGNRYQITKKYEEEGLEKMKIDILDSYNKAIKNFYNEKEKYLDQIQEIIGEELLLHEFVSFKELDYDVPIPIKAYVDLAIIDKEGNLKFIDHKLKAKQYSEESEIFVNFSTQTSVYMLAIEAKINDVVERDDKDDIFYSFIQRFPKVKEGLKEMIFIENKVTQNRGLPYQLKALSFDIPKTRVLLEAYLAEKVMAVCQAISNPEHIYLVNRNDFMGNDGIENYWISSYFGDIMDLDAVSEKVKLKILEKREKNKELKNKINKIPKEVLDMIKSKNESLNFIDMENKTPEEILEFRLKLLSCPATVAKTIEGYSCNIYLLKPEAGVAINTIINKKLDIANALNVEAVRVPTNLVELDGKSYIAVEANKKRTGKEKPINLVIPKEKNLFPLGEDMYKNQINWDISNHSTPHLLVSGSTGSGKSVCLNSIIKTAEKHGIRITILDSKYEFTDFRSKNITVINDQHAIEQFFEYTVAEVDEIFKEYGAKGYKEKHLIIMDEANDVLLKQTKKRKIMVPDKSSMVAMQEGRVKEIVDPNFKTLSQNIMSIAQKARSAGKHLVFASQRFDTKVLEGGIKANFSSRLCFTVSSQVDSRVMLDANGGEELNGLGDALFSAPGIKEAVRIQGYYSE